MYEPVETVLKRYEITTVALNLVTTNALMVWTIVMGLAVKFLFLRNSYTVSGEAHRDRTSDWAQAQETLQRRIKKLEKKVALHEIMHQGAS